jgi:hypothetical protein
MAYGWYQNHVNGIFTSLIKTPMIGLYNVGTQLGETFFYMALLILPLTVAFLPCIADLFKRRARILPVWFVFGAVVAVATSMKFIVVMNTYMPFSQNLLRVPVLGSLALLGINFPTLAKPWALTLTHVSAVSATLILAVLAGGVHRAVLRVFRLAKTHVASEQWRRNESRMLSQAYLCLSMGAVLALCVVQSAINDLDRYYIIPGALVIAFLLVCVRWLSIKPNWLIVTTSLVLFAAYSVSAQQDYMSWNRARWDAAKALEAKGIDAHDIDGGAEYDFVHNHALYNTHFRGAAPQNKWRWWSISGEEYIVAFSPVPGYEQVDTAKYWSALTPFKQRQLLILKRIEAQASR